MSDWALAQGDPIVNPFWHDPGWRCNSDCGYMDCRWLNCGCQGHVFWKDPNEFHDIGGEA